MAEARKETTSRLMVASKPEVSFWPDDRTSPGNDGLLYIMTNGSNWRMTRLLKPFSSEVQLQFT
jgi:hypothetical protein